MNKSNKLKVGIGFITGRKSFLSVLRSYLKSWQMNPLNNKDDVELHLFIAYDLEYTSTIKQDYIITNKEMLSQIESVQYINQSLVNQETKRLKEEHILDTEESTAIFGKGYAKMRNTVLYFAIKNNMDMLLFFDDDEYPLLCRKEEPHLIWQGQDPISAHIENLKDSDMTNGYHCGYISPIPTLIYNDILEEADFRLLIESVSNDIIQWSSIQKIMNQGGVTYANKELLASETSKIISGVNGVKFISGGNLGVNLQKTKNVFPFYNPIGARGEDTFLSTCLEDVLVKKIPCYTFHDGFQIYPSLLRGTLPKQLEPIMPTSAAIIRRFRNALIGWIRYKPLLLYITNQTHYHEKINEIRQNLAFVVPKLCNYFQSKSFRKIYTELDFYDQHVQEHGSDFENTKKIWAKVMLSMNK